METAAKTCQFCNRISICGWEICDDIQLYRKVIFIGQVYMEKTGGEIGWYTCDRIKYCNNRFIQICFLGNYSKQKWHRWKPVMVEELNPVNVVAAYNGKFIVLSAGGKSKVGYSEN